MADKGKDPLPIFKKTYFFDRKKIKILKFFGEKIKKNFTQAKQLNCNIITMPPKTKKIKQT